MIDFSLMIVQLNIISQQMVPMLGFVSQQWGSLGPNNKIKPTHPNTNITVIFNYEGGWT